MGKKVAQRGYWGDVVTGPFLSYGFEKSTEVELTTSKIERTTQQKALVI